MLVRLQNVDITGCIFIRYLSVWAAFLTLAKVSNVGRSSTAAQHFSVDKNTCRFLTLVPFGYFFVTFKSDSVDGMLQFVAAATLRGLSVMRPAFKGRLSPSSVILFVPSVLQTAEALCEVKVTFAPHSQTGINRIHCKKFYSKQTHTKRVLTAN